MSYHHITNVEQKEIGILLKKGYSHHDIARELACSQSSVSREITRNSSGGDYEPAQAKTKARQRRRYSKFQGMKVRGHPKLQAYIIEHLKLRWTPEQIAGRLKTKEKELPYISANSIYKWLYSVHGQKYCPLLCSKQLEQKKHGPKAKRSMIPNRVGIEERPEEANNRSEYGHNETDTIVSGKRHESTAALAVLHERKARYTRLKKIPDMKPKSMTHAVKHMAKGHRLRTLTYDNGIENKDHETVAKTLKIKTYFCNPYHSWEKGGVENTNGRIRRFIPKGADLADYSDKDIARIEHWLNHTPRKCLDWCTPYEIMIENHLFVSFTSPNSGDALEG